MSAIIVYIRYYKAVCKTSFIINYFILVRVSVIIPCFYVKVSLMQKFANCFFCVFRVFVAYHIHVHLYVKLYPAVGPMQFDMYFTHNIVLFIHNYICSY